MFIVQYNRLRISMKEMLVIEDLTELTYIMYTNFDQYLTSILITFVIEISTSADKQFGHISIGYKICYFPSKF